MKIKTNILSGARGMDASLLAKLLLEDGQKVYAFERHTQSPDYTNIKDILNHPNYILEKADVTDSSSVSRLVSTIKSDCFYHLAANSFVGCSWQEPIAVLNTNGGGTLNCLEAVRLNSPNTKFLFASTSEVVGNSKEPIQNEDTILTPHSPYAAAKALGEFYCKIYRFSHKLFCCYTRCYNHEHGFRGKEFVTKKSTSWIGENFNKVEKYILNQLNNNEFLSTEDAFNIALSNGIISQLKLGNLNSSRDWLSARDCVRGMKMVLEQDEPDNFVLASGKMHSISDFLTVAFNVIGIKNWKPFIGQDPKFLRPDDVVTLCGDYSKAKKILGWQPEVSFEDMIKEMVEYDIKLNE